MNKITKISSIRENKIIPVYIYQSMVTNMRTVD